MGSLIRSPRCLANIGLWSLGVRKTSAVDGFTRAQTVGCERSFVSQFIAHTVISVTAVPATKPKTALAKRDLQNGDGLGADLAEEGAIGVREYAMVSESLGVVLDSGMDCGLDRFRRLVLLACSHRFFHDCSSRSSARTIHLTWSHDTRRPCAIRSCRVFSAYGCWLSWLVRRASRSRVHPRACRSLSRSCHKAANDSPVARSSTPNSAPIRSEVYGQSVGI